jgi:hypothetical protein
MLIMGDSVSGLGSQGTVNVASCAVNRQDCMIHHHVVVPSFAGATMVIYTPSATTM